MTDHPTPRERRLRIQIGDALRGAMRGGECKGTERAARTIATSASTAGSYSMEGEAPAPTPTETARLRRYSEDAVASIGELRVPAPTLSPAPERAPEWCPNCDKGVIGGQVCETCGGRGLAPVAQEDAPDLDPGVAAIKGGGIAAEPSPDLEGLIRETAQRVNREGRTLGHDGGAKALERQCTILRSFASEVSRLTREPLEKRIAARGWDVRIIRDRLKEAERKLSEVTQAPNVRAWAERVYETVAAGAESVTASETWVKAVEQHASTFPR